MQTRLSVRFLIVVALVQVIMLSALGCSCLCTHSREGGGGTRKLAKIGRGRSQTRESEDRQRRKADDEAKTREEAEEEQIQRAKVCRQLLGEFRVKLVITPSKSVAKMLGTAYSVELRDGPHPIEASVLNNAIEREKWLDVLSILQKEKLTELPDEDNITNVVSLFFRHKFTSLIRTEVDLSSTSPVSLSEGGIGFVSDSRIGRGKSTSGGDYVNGKRIAAPMYLGRIRTGANDTPP